MSQSSANKPVRVSKCGDTAELINKDLLKQRFNECQYLTLIMECLHFLVRQGIAFRRNEDVNDSLTQLLMLKGKDHATIIQRQKPKDKSKKLYTHHDYQDEFLQIKANQVLRNKITEVQSSNFYSIMCDYYKDISNKEQLSSCVKLVEKNLEARAVDFLGYYQVPDMKGDTDR